MKKKILLITSLIAAIFIFSSSNVLARSGCCSNHKGVCGCQCCDGTNLSATCAPYYPACNQRKTPNEKQLVALKEKKQTQNINFVSKIKEINGKIKTIDQEIVRLKKELNQKIFEIRKTKISKEDLKNKIKELNAIYNQKIADLKNQKNSLIAERKTIK